jgi:N-methylhydantoinase B
MSAPGAAAATPEIDNVTFSVMLRRLQSISREMAQALERSAVSSIIALCHDFSCVIYDAKGRQLSVHDPIPVHVTAMELQIEAIEETFGADVHDGDVFLANDPYRGNTHVGDIVVARPVFVDGMLVFWVMIKAHHIDVGAFEPSSCTTASRDIYQEGLQIPPVRIVAAGVPRHDVLELVYANVRLRDVVEGDLLAQIGSAERGHALILEFCEEFGLERAEAYADQVIDYASKRMATLFRAIPDGSYKGYGWVDSDGYAAKDIPIEVEVIVEGEHVTVDFDAGPQAEGGLNGTHATSLAAGRIPFLFLADPDIPHNQGCFDQIEVKVPRGTIAESVHPASTSCATMIPTGMLHDAINKALAPAIPDLIPAGTARSSTTPQFFGVDEVKNEDWGMMIFNACGGGGATKQADGWPLMETTGAMGGQKCVSIEQMELLYPVRVEHMEIEQDSMGFGTKVGGFGVRFTIRPMNGPMECITFGDGVANPPHGVLGGRPAIGGGHFVEEASSGNRRYISAAGRVRVPRGDTWTAVATGGGGYGPPLDRDAERVRTEVRDGVISRESAFEIFGVVLGDGEDPGLDLEATAARRAELVLVEVPGVLPEGPRAAAWVDDNLREGDVYLENPTVA